MLKLYNKIYYMGIVDHPYPNSQDHSVGLALLRPWLLTTRPGLLRLWKPV